MHLTYHDDEAKVTLSCLYDLNQKKVLEIYNITDPILLK